jgi:hypothetical protein
LGGKELGKTIAMFVRSGLQRETEKWKKGGCGVER